MKKLSVFLFVMLLFFGFAGIANTALIDRGSGLIYDSDQDITWLQDANYAATELTDIRVNAIISAVGSVAGHSLTISDFKGFMGNYPGYMTWWGAMAWADQLVYSGFDDWRLPTAPIDVWGADPDGEMGHLFHIDGVTYSLPTPFFNIQGTYYWTGTEVFTNDVLMFNLATGTYASGLKPGYDYFPIAVRDGDVSTVPEPIAVDIDIKFCSNPNAFNCKSRGKTPVTIFGTEDLDVTEIDISSLRLCIDGTCVESAPLAWSFADRGDPTTDLGAEECAIVEDVEQDYLNPDGYLDLDVAFDSQQIATLINCSELVKNDVSDTLYLTGELVDGTLIESLPVDNPGIDQLVKKNK